MARFAHPSIQGELQMCRPQRRANGPFFPNVAMQPSCKDRPHWAATVAKIKARSVLADPYFLQQFQGFIFGRGSRI